MGATSKATDRIQDQDKNQKSAEFTMKKVSNDLDVGNYQETAQIPRVGESKKQCFGTLL